MRSPKIASMLAWHASLIGFAKRQRTNLAASLLDPCLALSLVQTDFDRQLSCLVS